MSAAREHVAKSVIRRSPHRGRDQGVGAELALSAPMRQMPRALQHSTANAIRQHSLVQCQHSPGNAVVQRMLATTAIMRCGCAPGEACSCGRGGADAEREKKDGSK